MILPSVWVVVILGALVGLEMSILLIRGCFKPMRAYYDWCDKMGINPDLDEDP